MYRLAALVYKRTISDRVGRFSKNLSVMGVKTVHIAPTNKDETFIARKDENMGHNLCYITHISYMI